MKHHPLFGRSAPLSLLLFALCPSGVFAEAPKAPDAAPATALSATIVIQGDQPGHAISPSLYGLMTEEINHSYEGGLYAELLQNRSFQDDPAAPTHWSLACAEGAQATLALAHERPLNEAQPVSLRMEIKAATPDHRAGVANDGYWGVPIRPVATYTVSFYARARADFTGPLTVALESADGGRSFARVEVSGVGAEWKHFTATLKTDASAPATAAGRFSLSAGAPGTVWLSLVSLFPATYHDRPNGLRPDLMEKMAAMRPSFLRFPGGNYLEGDFIKERFDWKKMIHGVESRPGHRCCWGYRSNDGMGLLEFLNWCEDLRMEPLLAVFAGYSLKGEHVEKPGELAPFVQDALDEIEYVMGDATTKWGGERVKDGHPAPFPLRYVEVGNEDFFDRSQSYEARFAQFYDAIKAKYPQLQIIATRGVSSRKPDVVDQHLYRSPRSLALDATHFDKANRNGPKIFVGEWASLEGKPTPTLQAALGDAAWMTGLERNSDVVVMSCYAPLLVNVNPGASQWGTNLIGYDALHSFGSPSYYAQKMFAENKGDVWLPMDLQLPSADKMPAPKGQAGVGSFGSPVEFKDISIQLGGGAETRPDLQKSTGGFQLSGGKWTVAEGVLNQPSEETNTRAILKGVPWGDGVITLKARKLSGTEGFRIFFHYLDGNLYGSWTVGGWKNTKAGLTAVRGGAADLGPRTDVVLETGRWYDVRVELVGCHVRCFLDGKLMNEADEPPLDPPALIATASRVNETGEVILKAVNFSDRPVSSTVAIKGSHLTGGRAILLTGDPAAQNTLETPKKVVPNETPLHAPEGSGSFQHEFPAHSVTVLRMATH